MKRLLKQVRNCFSDSRASCLIVLALTAIWGLLAILVQPVGNFPLNDDWSYSRAVQTLLEMHRLRIDDWGAPTLFAQILYGALFCMPFGFSFTALRISTLVAGLAGVLGLFALLRQSGVSRGIAFVGSLTLLVNPLYFLHAFTFMTDVPFLALSIWSTLFFVRALKFDSGRALLIATLLSCAATLVRQLGIALPIAYLFTVLLTNKFSFKSTARAALPTVISIAVLVGYTTCIQYFGVGSAIQGTKQDMIATRLAHDGLGRFVLRSVIMTGLMSLYVGLFSLPFLSVLASRAWRQCLAIRTQIVVAVAASSALIAYVALFFYRGRQMPFFGNTMNHAGLGPLTMRNADERLLMTESLTPTWFWDALTVAAGAGTILLVLLLSITLLEIFRRRLPRKNDLIRVALFSLLAAGILTGPTSVIAIFDRYVLVLMPLVILLLSVSAQLALNPARSPSLLRYSLAAIFLGAYGVLSVAGTHDYLAWNRARWQAVTELIEEQGVSPKTIDGGFEVSGWLLFHRDEQLRAKWDTKVRTFDVSVPDPNEPPAPFYWLADPDYVVAFEPHENSKPNQDAAIIKRYPFRSWLWRREEAIVVLKVTNPHAERNIR